MNGVFLGLSDNSDEVVVWGPEGIRKARTIRRRPEEQMWNREEVLAVKGTPLQPNPENDDGRIRTKLVPGLATTEIIGDPITAQEVKAEVGEQRSYYFMRADVKIVASKIGYTDIVLDAAQLDLDFHRGRLIAQSVVPEWNQK